LIKNTSIHAGIRAPLLRRKGDVRNDKRCGFETVKARDLDAVGMQGVVERIKERVGDSLVYVSVDIDVLDPAYAPGESCGCSFFLVCLLLVICAVVFACFLPYTSGASETSLPSICLGTNDQTPTPQRPGQQSQAGGRAASC
jgi:hypothetical protein